MNSFNFSILLVALGLVSIAEESAPLESKPQIIERSPSELQIGKIIVNKESKEIHFPGKVNLVEGISEFFLVTNTGKIHESIFTTEASPTNLNIAIKLLGIPESKELAEILENYLPSGKFPEVDEKTKQAARLTLSVRVDEKTLPAHTFILKNGTPLDAPMDWVYTGSYFHEGSFMAEAEGAFIGIYMNESSLISHGAKDRLDDELWTTNKDVIPAFGTPVTFILSQKAK